jgi:hypothetical protein
MEKVAPHIVPDDPRACLTCGLARDPLCDLLSLLLTGRPVTTALTELIENGVQTTERVRGTSELPMIIYMSP